jgi:hypothetical protein
MQRLETGGIGFQCLKEKCMPKGFTKEELERLEEISFRNMVGFFREELNRSSKGELAKKVLTKGDRRCLRRLGVLRLKGHWLRADT